jgi:hypothetical protein|tara:strand:- start:134 stop:523 length:390 start_codon:yes stop_codon:yes gene_type:complete
MKPVFRDFLRAACEFYDISEADMMGKSRKAILAQPRHVMVYAYKIYSGALYTEVANRIGRDHTTIINSVRFVENLLDGIKPVKSLTVEAGDVAYITKRAEGMAAMRRPITAAASFGSDWADCDMSQLEC